VKSLLAICWPEFTLDVNVQDTGIRHSVGYLSQVLHGMSKDFCSNGLRYDPISLLNANAHLLLIHSVGILISQHNPECIRAVMSIALFMKISSAADTLFYAILSSRAPALATDETDPAKICQAIQSACDSTDPLDSVDISDSFGAWFVAENRRRLTDSAAYMTRWFTDRGFRVYPANAGAFTHDVNPLRKQPIKPVQLLFPRIPAESVGKVHPLRSGFTS
jgi:hypothetical protein